MPLSACPTDTPGRSRPLRRRITEFQGPAGLDQALEAPQDHRPARREQIEERPAGYEVPVGHPQPGHLAHRDGLEPRDRRGPAVGLKVIALHLEAAPGPPIASHPASTKVLGVVIAETSCEDFHEAFPRKRPDVTPASRAAVPGSRAGGLAPGPRPGWTRPRARRLRDCQPGGGHRADSPVAEAASALRGCASGGGMRRPATSCRRSTCCRRR